jgi:hypothetical protein
MKNSSKHYKAMQIAVDYLIANRTILNADQQVQLEIAKNAIYLAADLFDDVFDQVEIRKEELNYWYDSKQVSA